MKEKIHQNTLNFNEQKIGEQKSNFKAHLSSNSFQSSSKFPKKHSIKSIVFDIDGTLFSDWRARAHDWFTVPFTKYVVGYTLAKLRDGYRRKKVDFINKENFWKEQTNDMCTLLTKKNNQSILSLKAMETLILYNLYERWDAVFFYFKLSASLFKLMDYLKNETGVKIGVVSDLVVQPRIRFMGLNSHVDFAFSAEDVGALKPHPKVFDEIIKQSGCKAEEIIYVGNAYEWDVKGAWDNGLWAIHRALFKKPNSVAIYTYHRHQSLLNFLKNTEILKNKN